MSASLVGSEMCIRDSCKNESGCSADRARRLGARTHADNVSGVRPDSAAACLLYTSDAADDM
eukprot:8764625-Alexandrium_andersonii.AAC.1